MFFCLASEYNALSEVIFDFHTWITLMIMSNATNCYNRLIIYLNKPKYCLVEIMN